METVGRGIFCASCRFGPETGRIFALARGREVRYTMADFRCKGREGMARSAVKDLTEGSPVRLVLGFAGPLLFGFLFQQLYSFVDTAIVGRYLSAEALAAVGSTSSLNFLILGFCMGICSGFSIPIAQAFGAKDETELRRYVAHSVYLCAVISVVMALATGLLCPALLRLMNTPEEILDSAVSYIQLIFFAIPVTVTYNMASGIMRSLGDSRTPVIFLAMAAIVNIVLDVAFILVFHLGVMGAALATVISQLASGVGCVLVIIKRYPLLRMSKDDLKYRPFFVRQLVGMGIPFGLQYSITAIGSVMMQTAVNGLGTIAVAAVTAGGKLSAFFACVFDALASTMATFAGQNIGARKLERVDQGLRAAGLIGTIYCLIAVTVVWLWGDRLVGLFIDAKEEQVIALAHQFIKTNSAFYIPLLFVNIVRFSIQGMGFTKLAMFAGLAEMVARTLVAVVFVPLFGFTIACFANPAAWIAADLFLFPCYARCMKHLRLRMRTA